MNVSPSVLPPFLAMLSVLLPSPSPTFVQQPSVDFTQLEKVALKELTETNTPGAAIAIVSGDRIIFAKGLGVSSVETGVPVTVNMSEHTQINLSGPRFS